MKITKDIKLALKYLKIGVIAHPTDTIYGLGCLANNLNAIQKMINLKKRDGATATGNFFSNKQFFFREKFHAFGVALTLI